MNGKVQRIKVNKKGQLLAAFECAKEVSVPTEIELTRKTGITMFKLLPYLKNSTIKKLKGKIRKIPAKGLLA